MRDARHRGARTFRLLFLILLTLQVSCVRPGEFACRSAEDCAAAGTTGTCEPTGYCSFVDTTCASGRRYGRYARGDLCDACVSLGDAGPIDPDGAVMAPGCGGTSLLRDDFNDGIQGLDWGRSYKEGGVTRKETLGELVITLASGAAGSTYGGLVSSRTYNLTGDQVAVRVVDMVSTTTDAEAFLEVRAPDGNALRILQRHGDLHFQKRVAGVLTTLSTTKYSAILHEYWRIREAEGDIHWETSGNGVNYTSHARATRPFDVTVVDAQLGAGTPTSITSPGSVGFDDFNVEAPLGRFCKASSFADDFNDGVRGPAWSRSYADVGCNVSETGGEVVLSVAPGTEPFCAYATGTAYDLADDAVVVRVPTMINVGSDAHVYFHVIDRNRDSVQIIQEAGELVARKQHAGDYLYLGSEVYSTAKHLWWRLRESGKTLFWETSPDGNTWAILHFEAAPLDTSAVDIEFGLGVLSTGGALPGELHVDDYNRAP